MTPFPARKIFRRIFVNPVRHLVARRRTGFAGVRQRGGVAGAGALLILAMLVFPPLPVHGKSNPALGIAAQLIAAKQWEPAAKELMRVLSKTPEDQQARLMFAQVMLELEQYGDAHGLSDVLIKEGYAKEKSLLIRGRARIGILDYQGAVDDIKQAIRMNANVDIHYFGFDLAIGLQHTDACKEALALVTRLYQTNANKYKAEASYYRLVSACHRALGEFREARAVSQRGMRTIGLDPWLMDDMGWAELGQGREYAAAETFRGVMVMQQGKIAKAPPLRLDYPFRGTVKVLRGVGAAPDHMSLRSHFSWDLQLMGKFDRAHERAGRKVEQYFCYGAPVLSPVDGWVVAAVDHRPDNKIGEPDWRYPEGNHLRLYTKEGPTVLLAHLRKGSVKVKKGEAVKIGQELAACGNSGGASEPHLHIGVRTGPKDGDPTMPAVFASFRQRSGARIDAKVDAVPEAGALLDPCTEECGRKPVAGN